jgi:hypothetical protein
MLLLLLLRSYWLFADAAWLCSTVSPIDHSTQRSRASRFFCKIALEPLCTTMPSNSSRSDAVSTIAPAAQLGVAIAALVFLKAVKRAKQSAAAPASEVVGAYESTLSQLCHVALPHVAPKHPDLGTFAHFNAYWLQDIT